MSTETIFYVAIVVFALMFIGIVLTELDFRKAARSSAVAKDPDARN